jgi:hypothetical protein
MALAQQTMFRAARLESGIFTTCLEMALNHDGTPFTPMSPDLVGDLSLDIEITRAQNRNYALADGFHRLARKDNTFPLFLRYKVQTERLYRRAVEEFERLKKLRPELPTEPISEVQPKENKPNNSSANEPISNLPGNKDGAGRSERIGGNPPLSDAGPAPDTSIFADNRGKLYTPFNRNTNGNLVARVPDHEMEKKRWQRIWLLRWQYLFLC